MHGHHRGNGRDANGPGMKMGPSHPASILLRSQFEEAKKERDGAKLLLEKIQAAEKRLRTRQDAVEAATTKRDQLQLSVQAVQDKLHEAHAQTGT